MKQINLQIKDCADCPYLRYDAYYGMSQDSGHDCEHPEATRTRIWNDGDKKPELPPNWCPLPEAK